jgi:MerR family transcriptional regulator, heat shock protein HspR
VNPRRLTRVVSRLILGSAQLLKGLSALDQDLYFISVAARMLGMHPQTLRKYERLGLVQPTRTIGSMRVYSREEIERLKVIKHLVDEGGINLAGVQRLLSIAEVVQRIRPLMSSRDEALSPRNSRRLTQELDELIRMLGLD